jgi:hypothetical protein
MDNGASSRNRIEPTPVRISTNLTIERQTPKTDFGDRLRAGMETVGGIIASGAAVAAPFVPGGAIVSAAVSSVTTMGGQLAGAGGQASVAQQYASGVVGLGGGGTGINTTVGMGGGGVVGNTGIGGGGIGGGGIGVGGGVAAPNPMGNGVNTQTVGGSNVDINKFTQFMEHQQRESYQMLGVQMQMNRENQVFTTVSNVLKTRHDTVKNTISNVR